MTDEVSKLAKKIIPKIPELNSSYQTTRKLNAQYLIVVLIMLMGSIIAFLVLAMEFNDTIYFIYYIALTLN